MPRRHRHRAARKPVQTQTPVGRARHAKPIALAVQPALEAPHEPNRNQGQIYKQELVDATSGHAKRFRHVSTTPLSMAYHAHKLKGAGDVVSGIMEDDRYAAGERFAVLWYKRESTGGNPFERVGGGDRYWWNDTKADASDIVRRIRERMYGKNFAIVQAFCGEGWSMAASVRKAGVESHPNGIAPRVREALDDLVTVMTGRRAA